MGENEPGSNPNIGKDLTNEQKKELGGTGSGTPGGWEPQDEENARSKIIKSENGRLMSYLMVESI